MAQNGISTLSTKQARQVAKLNLAQTKRTAGGNTSLPAYRPLHTYVLARLPTVYSGNAVSDNANAGGLLTGRPWS